MIVINITPVGCVHCRESHKTCNQDNVSRLCQTCLKRNTGEMCQGEHKSRSSTMAKFVDKKKKYSECSNNSGRKAWGAL
ncbi:hypothetical protein BD408DRAFT_69133 [Parasitella parasitica]|nr:hypothetical protein BD408DRAFT_69133 [Parasitella parasitica]